MTRCEFTHDFVRDCLEMHSARLEHELTQLTPDYLARLIKLRGSQCTMDHQPPKDFPCSTDDCSLRDARPDDETFNHSFTVGEEKFFMTAGPACWDCFRNDCGYNR